MLPISSPVTVDEQLPIGVGSLRITVISGKDISNGGEVVKPYVALKFGDKERETKHTAKTTTPEWEESFTFSADQETRNLRLTVKESKPFAKDPSLGEADIDIWRHLQPTSAGPISAADVTVELREGMGQVRLRLEFERTTAPRAGSFVSATGARPSISSRFSPRRKADE
jgi:Ca2+-dependent lipid-binding protein